MRKFFFLLLLSFSFSVLQAQQGSYEDETIFDKTETPDSYDAEDGAYDTILQPQVYVLLKDSELTWKKANAYSYNKNLDSLLKDWQSKAYSQQRTAKPRKPNFLDGLLAFGFLKPLLWLLAIVFIIFILSKLVLNKGFFEKGSRNSTINALPDEVAEDLNQDFESLILASENKNDLRSSIRFRFLQALKLLGEKEYINYHPDKTNKTYQQEIPAELQKNFAGLIRFYEYSWYGNRQFSNDQYNEIAQQFSSFNQSIFKR